MTEPTKMAVPAAFAEDILSGQVCVRDADGAFEVAQAADATTFKRFFFAVQDTDSESVTESERLTGLDCSDQFVLRTGYFKPDETYAIDDELTVGNLGILVPAVSGDTVVARVHSIGDQSNGSYYHDILAPEADPDDAGSNDVLEIATAYYVKP